nr:MAG TPA: hypothetical protein [Caudoviricetes sp.]
MAEIILINSGIIQKTLETSDGKTCDIVFNPTDSVFVEKLFTAFDTLDKKQEAYKVDIEKTGNKREVFEIARKMDEEMREIIGEVFGFDICAALFGEMNVYALADGLPVWANLMLAIMDEVDTVFAREQKATNPRVARYTKKYHK